MGVYSSPHLAQVAGIYFQNCLNIVPILSFGSGVRLTRKRPRHNSFIISEAIPVQALRKVTESIFVNASSARL